MIQVRNRIDRVLQARRVLVRGDGTVAEAGSWQDMPKKGGASFLPKDTCGPSGYERTCFTVIEVRLKVRPKRKRRKS